MPTFDDLLSAVLDSWDRNNRILINLLRALPPHGLELRVTEGSPTVSRMFTHMIYCRLVFLQEDAPDFADEVPTHEWLQVDDPDLIADALMSSARRVRDAVEHGIRTNTPMQQHYDHPLLFLQHMIWHEGYHHGQIKLALKLAGKAFDDEAIGGVTWDVWMEKSK